jgi:hypothetical protein
VRLGTLTESACGWAIDFGANSFLIGKAIQRCRNVIDQCRDLAASGQTISRSDLEAKLKKAISGCVANSNGEEYSGYYPIRHDDTLVFGAQGIGVDDGAQFMLDEADLEWEGDTLARPQPPAAVAVAETLIAKTPALPATVFNPVLLKIVDELELSVRSANCLKNDDIIYVGDVQKSEAEMLRTANFGRKSLNEIKEVLAQMGLYFGMEVPSWPPDNVEELSRAYAAVEEFYKTRAASTAGVTEVL